jgi:hypothetical protein
MSGTYKIGLLEYRKKWYKKHPEYHKKRYKENPEKCWAAGAISGKKRNGFAILFSNSELGNLATRIKFCRYCGCKLDYRPYQGFKKHGPSLDRINNKKDKLELLDVQIICHDCNSAKRSKTHNEFINWIKLVLRLNGKKK